MQLIIQNTAQNISVAVDLSDDRRELANLLSILDASNVDGLEIRDMMEARLPRNLQRMTQLRQLKLVRCHAIQDISPDLAKCPALKELAIINCADFHDLRGIQKCSALEILHISGCDAFEDIPLDIENMPQLRALDLSYCENIAWIDLARLPANLRLLDMHGCCRADFDPALCRALKLVSLQIQDASRIQDYDSESCIDDLETQMRHMMTLRDGCGLDA